MKVQRLLPFHRRRGAGCLRVALLLALPCTPVLAQQSPALDRMSLWLGGYNAHVDTRISASTGIDAERYNGAFSLEDDLGFAGRKEVARARLDLLVGDAQGFTFDYYRVNRANRTTLSRDIHYDGHDYLAATDLRARLDFDFGSVTYSRWLGHGNDVFGVGLGAAYYRVSTALDGDSSIDGVPVDHGWSRSTDGAWAPVLSLRWRHAFNDHWRMYADAAGVMRNGGKLSGHVVKAALGVEWLPWQHVGIGAEYGYSRVLLHQRKHDYRANLDMKLDGPSLFLKLRF